MVDALKRIPKWTRPVTYFSDLDVWLYHGVSDTKICPVCRAFELTGVFYGHRLRKNFPYLEIVGRDTIKANVHPNCRCYLVRYIQAWV